jgi:ABC-type antimicrobial peptide transport system permease subunit
VRERTAEIGVRLSLGATPRAIAGLVCRKGLTIVFAGWAIGAGAAWAAAGPVRSLLYGVAPSDAATFIGGSVVLCLAGLAGCLVPAIRAARVDPVIALRSE